MQLHQLEEIGVMQYVVMLVDGSNGFLPPPPYFVTDTIKRKHKMPSGYQYTIL